MFPKPPKKDFSPPPNYYGTAPIFELDSDIGDLDPWKKTFFFNLL